MAVKNLWDILEPCKQKLPLHHLRNKRVCVDLSCWIVQLDNAGKSRNAKDKPHLRGLFHRLRALIVLNCTLILVADGAIPALKLSTYKRRLGFSSEEHDMALHVASSLRRNMGTAFSNMIKEEKTLGLALGIPCLDGLEEAEAQCVSRTGIIVLQLLNLLLWPMVVTIYFQDGCFSADSDALLFGAKTVYRDIFLGDGSYVLCYHMVDIERRLGFERNSLITLVLILGSDYSHGLQGIDPASESGEGTSIKLDGFNFLLWSTSFSRFVGSHKKKYILTNAVPTVKSVDWVADNDWVATYLLKSVTQTIAMQVMAHASAKKMWEVLHEIHSNRSNINRLYNVVEDIHNLRKGTMCLSEYYGTMRNLWDEQDVYRPISTDTSVIAKQREAIHSI